MVNQGLGDGDGPLRPQEAFDIVVGTSTGGYVLSTPLISSPQRSPHFPSILQNFPR